MVATSQPLAVQAGLGILQQGGNAIDAAIATAAVLNVVEPHSTGVGGDMFALAYIAKTKELKGLNGSGFSIKAATRDFFLSRGMSSIPMYGPMSVSVPGTVDGWVTLLNKYGSMKLEQVLEPAIEYAEKGFPVSEIIAAAWAAGWQAPHRTRSTSANPHQSEYLIRGSRAAYSRSTRKLTTTTMIAMNITKFCTIG